MRLRVRLDVTLLLVRRATKEIREHVSVTVRHETLSNLQPLVGREHERGIQHDRRIQTGHLPDQLRATVLTHRNRLQTRQILLENGASLSIFHLRYAKTRSIANDGMIIRNKRTKSKL